MNCFYCDRIQAFHPAYASAHAEFDLGSHAPRCAKHWRYRCDACGQASHFARTAYCRQTKRFFCASCALDRKEIPDRFWGAAYYNRYQSPWSERWEPGLDRLEFEGRHPLDRGPIDPDPIDRGTPHLQRYPLARTQWRPEGEFGDHEARENWNRNADRWDAGYDEDGDRNRRYVSDEPMLQLLGEVNGLQVLDVGSGNGYLCRKLARAGARMTGVELSDRFFELATQRESQEPLGITYHHHTAVSMPFLEDNAFAKAVSNYVLMDIAEYEKALAEVHRVLRPGGCFVIVISHPCFSCGPSMPLMPAPDSPRREEQLGWLVDHYFRRGATYSQWRNFDPVLSFHRPLRDYWQAFQEVGFRVDGFEEPSISQRGLQELPVSRIDHARRICYSCIFRVVK